MLNRLCDELFSLCGLFLALLGAGTVAHGQPTKHTVQEVRNGSINIILRDRSDSRFEYVLLVSSTNIILQQAEFPNYQQRQFLQLPFLKRDEQSVSKLLEAGSPLVPPFPPPGPFFSRAICQNGRLISTERFGGNDEFARLLKKEISHLKASDVFTTNVPSLFSNDPELKRQFGL